MKKALFVGRFQPMHLGHLKAIKWILQEYDKIIIVIGSSQDSFTDKNPFTFEERKKMIQNTLKRESIQKNRYKIIGIPDVFDDKKWVDNIVKKVKFDFVLTKNPWTKRCFTEAKISVEPHPMFGSISGSKIRKMIKNNKKWEKYVPKEVEKIMKKINLKEKLGFFVFCGLQ